MNLPILLAAKVSKSADFLKFYYYIQHSYIMLQHSEPNSTIFVLNKNKIRNDH